jgi:hypothetical protein
MVRTQTFFGVLAGRLMQWWLMKLVLALLRRQQLWQQPAMPAEKPLHPATGLAPSWRTAVGALGCWHCCIEMKVGCIEAA